MRFLDCETRLEFSENLVLIKGTTSFSGGLQHLPYNIRLGAVLTYIAELSANSQSLYVQKCMRTEAMLVISYSSKLNN